MFHFTSERLADALAERRNAGLTVRILLDAAQAVPEFLEGLRRRGLDVRRVAPRGDERARFHHKYAVLDDRIVVTGSYNWTVMGDIANHENVLLLRDTAAAEAFRRDFDRTWHDTDLSRP